MNDPSATARWDQTRAKKRRVIDTSSERATWRCLNPHCRGPLPEWRIGYCTDTCSSQHRAELFADYMRRYDRMPANPARSSSTDGPGLAGQPSMLPPSPATTTA